MIDITLPEESQLFSTITEIFSKNKTFISLYEGHIGDVGHTTELYKINSIFYKKSKWAEQQEFKNITSSTSKFKFSGPKTSSASSNKNESNSRKKSFKPENPDVDMPPLKMIKIFRQFAFNGALWARKFKKVEAKKNS